MSDSSSETDPEEIELMRGGAVVSTLTGAFGQSLKETRLTALLGYLMALNPEPFMLLFGFTGKPQRVCLEERHDQGRSDILVETTRGSGVVEAKVDSSDPFEQVRRYPARWKALLTHRLPPKRIDGRAHYVNWQQLANLLERLGLSGSARVRYLSNDLLTYLRAHHMAKQLDSVEIYAREINEPVTLELFLKAQLYGCDYSKGSRLAEALYFAPHFGSRIANDHPGVNVGISYIARIESVGHAATWQEFKDLMRKMRGGAWLNRHAAVLSKLRSEWEWNEKTQRYFLLLGVPHLAFNPPVRKEGLQKGKGWLSKRFLSFDELYSAWGKEI